MEILSALAFLMVATIVLMPIWYVFLGPVLKVFWLLFKAIFRIK